MKRQHHIRHDKSPNLFVPPAVLEQRIDRTVRIEFDGGTSCNIPRLGYGYGYGSYRIDQKEIVRVEFDRMSANAAEVLTLVSAVRSVWLCSCTTTTRLTIHGDSKIALSRVHKSRKAPSGSEIFKNACAELARLCADFGAVETHWRGRLASVDLFGH